MTKKFLSVCVYCGSSSGINPVYADAAKELGRALVKHHLSLVYGGGHVGLMGIVADAVLEAGFHKSDVVVQNGARVGTPVIGHVYRIDAFTRALHLSEVCLHG